MQCFNQWLFSLPQHWNHWRVKWITVIILVRCHVPLGPSINVDATLISTTRPNTIADRGLVLIQHTSLDFGGQVDVSSDRWRQGVSLPWRVYDWARSGIYVSSGIHMSVRTHDSQAEHCIFLTDLLKSKEISIYHVTKQRKEAHILAFANLNDL